VKRKTGSFVDKPNSNYYKPVVASEAQAVSVNDEDGFNREGETQ